MTTIKEIRVLPPRIKEIEKPQEESKLEHELEEESTEQFSQFMSRGEMTSPVLRGDSGAVQESFEEPLVAAEKEKEAQLRRPYDTAQSPLMAPHQSRMEVGSAIPILQSAHNFADSGMSRLRTNELARISGEQEERRYDEPLGVEMKKFERHKEVWE